ncbi:N-acetylmuramoyl-L-alanine amidase [Candidatus Pacearchaeota archaeon]|nr:N-acetylmuramoyl-L-alanine amidase [Candidatus Pacearchaeota archaeon]
MELHLEGCGSSKSNVFYDRIYALDKTGLRKNKPEYLVLHSTYKYPAFEDLFACHKGLGWNGVGYHLYVDKTANVSQTRPFNVEGAHTLGLNTKSIGLCYYSDNGKVSPNNVVRMQQSIEFLKNLYPNIKMKSHTQAQVDHINDLAQKQGIGKVFDTSNLIVGKKRFRELSREVLEFAKSLNPLNRRLRTLCERLTNCPGESFSLFLDE